MTAGTSTNRRRATTVVVVLILLVAGACGHADRPTVETWQATWQKAQQAIPPPQTLGHPPDQETCEQVLGDLRELRGRLLPGPDPVVDDALRDWVAYAESVFFDCFEAVDSADPVEAAYRRLGRLRAEVETALKTVGPIEPSSFLRTRHISS